MTLCRAYWVAMLALVAVCAAAILSGCADKPIVQGCPPVVIYDKEFSRRLAEEIAPLPFTSPTKIVVVDYTAERDRLCLCQTDPKLIAYCKERQQE